MTSQTDPIATRDRQIGVLALIVGGAFLANVLFYFYRVKFGGVVYPFNSFLPNGLFGDFFGSYNAWMAGGFATASYGMAYFPSTFLFLQPFLLIPNPLVSAICFSILVVGFTLGYAYRSIRSANTVGSWCNAILISLTSYPLLFEVATGNVEGLLFAFLVFFVYFYRAEKFAIAACFLAAAASMKLFPAVFVVLFVADRRWRELAYFAGFTAFFTLAPLLLFYGGQYGPGGFAGYFERLHQSELAYSNLMIMTIAGMHYGHSLLNGLQAALGPFFPSGAYGAKLYAFFTVVVFALVSLYVVYVERVFWKRIALLTVAMCILPYTSTDYKLLEIFIPLFLFINRTDASRSDPLDRTYLVLFALLLIPKTPLYLWHDGSASLNTVLNPLIMIVIVGLIVVSGLRRFDRSRLGRRVEGRVPDGLLRS